MPSLETIRGALTNFRAAPPIDGDGWGVIARFNVARSMHNVTVANRMSEDEAVTLAEQLSSEYPDGYPVELRISALPKTEGGAS